MAEPRLRVDGAARTLSPIATGLGRGRPTIAGAASAEVALLYPLAALALTLQGGPRGPLSALTRAPLAGLELADPEELHGTGLGDALELFSGPTGGPWWVRHRSVARRTTLFPLAGGGPPITGLGRSDGAACLEDGRILLVDVDEWELLFVCPDGQVERAPITGWRGGESLATLAGGWLFSSHADGHARVLSARRLAADGVGAPLELGRVDHHERPTYPAHFHVRGAPGARHLAVVVSLGSTPPRLLTAALSGDRWTPLRDHGDARFDLDAVALGDHLRVAWEDPEGALQVVDAAPAGARRRTIAAPEGVTLRLLGDRLLGLWDDDRGLALRLHDLEEGPREGDPAVTLELPGEPWAWDVEVIARGAHGLLLLSEREAGRAFALRIGADASLLALP